MIRALAVLFALAFAAPAQAHDLRVFAFVEDAVVVVEARFSSGRTPREGRVQVFDAADRMILQAPLRADGTLRFQLTEDARESGLRIVVATGGGHEDYWILTPADIAAGSGTGG